MSGLQAKVRALVRVARPGHVPALTSWLGRRVSSLAELTQPPAAWRKVADSHDPANFPLDDHEAAVLALATHAHLELTGREAPTPA